MRKYGKNFKLIAAIMGSKTQNHLKSFYVHYRNRYSIDGILKEYNNIQNIFPEIVDVVNDGEENQVKLKKPELRCYPNCL